MRKIFTLAALLVGMASTAFALQGGGFTWYGSGATYDATAKALILENANLTQLDVATSSSSESNYGTIYKIIVRGTCTISPSAKLNGINFANTNFGNAPTLKIVGEGENPSLTMNGQDEAGLYIKKTCYLDLENIKMTCNGKLNTAQYGISAASSCDFTLRMRTNVLLTLDGKTSQWNNLYSFLSCDPTVIDPAGATINMAYNNNFIIYNGENYNGKATLATGSGVTIGGVEVDYTNGDNFTNTVTSGKVTLKDGVLRFENATITGEIVASSNVTLELAGTNTVQNNVTFVNITMNGDNENAQLNINGQVTLRSVMTLNNVHFRNVATGYTMGPMLSGEVSHVVLNSGSFYAEGTSMGIEKAYVSVPYGYVIDEGTTAANKKYIYARELKTYLDYVVTQDGVSHEINSENASDVLGDGTVAYDRPTKTMTLKNAKLASVVFAFFNSTLYLEGNNQIFANATTENPPVGAAGDSLTITGPGSVTLITQQADKAAIVKPGPSLVIRNTTVNITTQSYAITGIEFSAGSNTYSYPLDVLIDNSNVSIQSGQVGALNLISNFTLERAEFVSPADVDYFNGQFCVNYQPIAANTKVEIKALAQGIEEVIANTPDNKAHKVLVDGVIYIVRDGKLFNLQGARVK